jgi:HK97 family phage portal protein
MSLLSWARERLGLTDGPRWARYYGGENWAGKPVTADGAMQLSAWWRGVKLYAEATGAASLKFYERLDNDDRKRVRDHPIADLISIEPNMDQTTQEFWGSQAAALCIFGNAYAEKQFIGSRIVALEPLPYDTYPFRDPQTNELRYRFNYLGKTETLPREKVFHTKGFSLGGDLGISPLSAARQELSISLATEQAAGQTFAQGMRHSGFFTGPTLTQPQREAFTLKFINPLMANDAKAHYGILENGFEFKEINIPPKDAEMLLTRRHNIEELARFMGLPPILLGHAADGQTMWGTGVESIINQWLTLGLDAFWSNIEKSINKRLLNAADRRRYYAEFDRDAMLRGDSASRAEFISKMIQNAQITPNEGRKKANLPPMTGGDRLLVNSTLVPLEQAGQRPVNVQPAPGEPIPPSIGSTP